MTRIEGYFGTIKVPLVLHNIKCLIALQTTEIGGTIQLTPFLQFCVNASTASTPGFQNLELNLGNFYSNYSQTCPQYADPTYHLLI